MAKYHNKKTVVAGITFDSKAEASRYIELSTLEMAGKISALRLQERFKIADPCVIHGRKHAARYYVADFVYTRDGKKIIEDKKGVVTPMYSLKRHLMKSVLGLDILETF
jgi:hypothetical protein